MHLNGRADFTQRITMTSEPIERTGLYQCSDMIDPNDPYSHFGTQRYKIKLLLRDLTIRTKVMREMTR